MKFLSKLLPGIALLFCASGVLYSCDDDTALSSEAEILTMNIESPLVLMQPAPVAGQSELSFVVSTDSDPAALQFAPSLTVTPGARVEPASGSMQDFTAGPVTYTVTAEDQSRRIYTVRCVRMADQDTQILALRVDGDTEGFVDQNIVYDGTNITFTVGYGITDEQLQALQLDFDISTGATITPISGEEPDFSVVSEAIYRVMSSNGITFTDYTVICHKVRNSEARILSFELTGADAALLEGNINLNEADKTITFNMNSDATVGSVELSPVLTLSDQATVSPASGERVTFTYGVATPYTVKSGDGLAQEVYNVMVTRLVKYTMDMDQWRLNPGTAASSKYYLMDNWASSNSGVSMLMIPIIGTGYRGEFPVAPTSDAYAGDAAARLVTCNTIGKKWGSQIMPKITAGSFYLGVFETDTNENLNSTKFGIPFTHGKPTKVTLQYKYTPGPVFYRAEVGTHNVAVEEPGTIDKCAISVVLYEVSGFGEEYNDERLTGMDITNSPRIVASAYLQDQTEKSNWTELVLDLNYLQEYDPAKFYRLAVIFSSSSQGATFSGAPGSELIVDEIVVECL